MSKLEDAAADEAEGLLAQINIIPFVDIVLVLLIIFMLTSATIVRSSLKVELPKAASGGSQVETTLNLVYSKDDKLLVNGQAVPSLTAAGAIVRQMAAAHPETPARDAADQSAAARAAGQSIHVVDAHRTP